jgi:hypothetical protein
MSSRGGANPRGPAFRGRKTALSEPTQFIPNLPDLPIALFIHRERILKVAECVCVSAQPSDFSTSRTDRPSYFQVFVPVRKLSAMEVTHEELHTI